MSMRFRVRTSLSALLVVVALTVTACGGKKDATVTETFMPEASMTQADQLMADGSYEEARKVLVEVKNRDASKKYAQQAQLKIADSYIREGEPDLGIEEYRKFIEMYPASEYAAAAQYQIAMAYYRQIESPEKSSGAAQKALQEFHVLKDRYPRNPYREAVDLRIQKTKNIIADGEFSIGQFYYKKGSYSAALGRFEGLLKRFPDYKGADEVLLLMVKSYSALKMRDKAEEALKVLEERYPASKFTAEARKGVR